MPYVPMLITRRDGEKRTATKFFTHIFPEKKVIRFRLWNLYSVAK